MADGFWPLAYWAVGSSFQSILLHALFWLLRLIPTLSFSQPSAPSFISPEDKLLAFSRDRGEGVLAALVEDFVGSECPENWLASNLLILSCERHIHFFMVLFVSEPQVRLCRAYSSLLRVVLRSTLLCQNIWPSSVGLHFPQTDWHLFSTDVCPLPFSL